MACAASHEDVRFLGLRYAFLPLQPAGQELKGKWGRGVRARPSSCTPLNSHTQNETVPSASFPFNVCHAGYIHCVPINTVKAPVLSKTIKNQSCFTVPSMDSFDILLLEFRVQLNLSVRTPLYYGQFQCPDKILIYFL